jgi:hypothetical protein
VRDRGAGNWDEMPRSEETVDHLVFWQSDLHEFMLGAWIWVSIKSNHTRGQSKSENYSFK